MLSQALRLRPCAVCARTLSARTPALRPSLALAQIRYSSGEPASGGPRRKAAWPSERTRKKAVEKARRLQALLATEQAPASSPSTPAAADDSAPPTLDDLLALQPEEDPRPKSADYAARHSALCQKLDRAFVRDQLISLCEQLGFEVKPRQTKTAMVQKILDSWGWKRPKKPEKAYTQMFPLSSATLFHLQRNLSLMEWLETVPGTAISVAPAEGGGYTMTADGPKASLDAVSRFIHDFVNTLTIVPLPKALGDITSRTRWEVSQVTGAWIDEHGITGNPSSVRSAEDMLLRLSREPRSEGKPVVIEREGTFSLVPHAPSAPLPWAAHVAVDGRGMFRLVGGARDVAEEENDDLASMSVLQAAGSTGKSVVLSSLVADNGATFARFGHHLLPASSPEASLHPPIEAGPLNAASPLASMTGMVFSPAVPPTLVRFPLSEKPRRLRRVTYALPKDKGKLIVTYEYPEREVDAARPTSEEPHWTQLLEQQLKSAKGVDLFAKKPQKDEFDIDELDRLLSADHEEDGDDLVDEILGASRSDIDRLIEQGVKEYPPLPELRTGESAEQTEKTAEEAEGPKKSIPVSAQIETGETKTDVLLPWKPIDVRFVSRSVEKAEVPEQLREFFADVAENGDYVANLALDDVTNLKRGTRPPKPSAAEPGLRGEEIELDYLESLGREEKDDSVIAPPPLEVKEEKTLTPPRQITVGGETATLAADEILDITESVRPHGMGPKPTLRAVRVVNLATPGGVLQYAELDGEGIWDEISSVARPVPVR